MDDDDDAEDTLPGSNFPGSNLIPELLFPATDDAVVVVVDVVAAAPPPPPELDGVLGALFIPAAEIPGSVLKGE